MKIKNYFSTNLLSLLKEKNITQKKLAHLLNTKESVISLWVNGKTKPSSKSILKLAEIFDIPVGYFFDNNIEGFKNSNNLSNKENTEKMNLNLVMDLIKEINKRFDSENNLLKKEIEILRKDIELLKKNK